MNALHQRGRGGRLALACEPLEDRLVPATITWVEVDGPGLDKDQYDYEINRTITIQGTSENDEITITEQNGMLRIHRRTVFFNPLEPATEETELDFIYKGTRLVVHAGAGDDEVRNNTSLPSVIYGEDGFDLLVGGTAGDEIHTGNNMGGGLTPGAGIGRTNDFAYGRAGKDTLIGGDGTDQLFGEDGADLLHGNGGFEDLLLGGNDDDTLYGGAGDDQLYGEEGMDSMYGEAGNDILIGGNGADYFNGGADDDDLQASGDNAIDQIITGSGSDVIHPDWHLVIGSSVKIIDENIYDLSVDDTIVF